MSKEGLLDEYENVSLAIVAKFSIIEIKMKSDWRWKVKMLVHEILPKTHHDYSIRLEFDPTPYDDSIRMFSKEIDSIISQPSLLKEVDDKSISDIQKKMDKVKEEMLEMHRECPDIEFVTQTEEIKYKNGDTALLFNVLDTVIEPLNAQKFRLSRYRAVLEPIHV